MQISNPLKLAFGCDHAGYFLHTFLIDFAKSSSFEVIDCGAFDQSSVDYPDYAKCVSKKVLEGAADFGVLICGTGIGMSIAANKQKGIRAALCVTEYEAMMARQHNDANILCLGARVIGEGLAKQCLLAFLKSEFLGGRHQDRIQKIEIVSK